MKTKILLLISAAALAATAVNASDALLSPRAFGNQIKYVAGATGGVNLAVVNRDFAGSPRAFSNQIKTVAAATTEINPAAKCARKMVASPRAIAECASHPAAAMLCCAAK